MDCEIRRVRQGDEKILAYIQTTSWKNAFDQVMLWVFVENIRARGFYEALGFVATDKVTHAFGTEEICYIKNL